MQVTIDLPNNFHSLPEPEQMKIFSAKIKEICKPENKDIPPNRWAAHAQELKKKYFEWCR